MFPLSVNVINAGLPVIEKDNASLSVADKFTVFTVPFVAVIFPIAESTGASFTATEFAIVKTGL